MNIANEIISVLKKFNLTNKILALTTDNESAIVMCGQKLMEKLEQVLGSLSFNHYHYSAHILNLIIK